MQKLTTPEEVDQAFNSPQAVIYKHSTLCPISRHAHREVALFMKGSPQVPVYIVDVLHDKAASRHLEQKTGVRHESPQAFVLRSGVVKWHDSHYRISAETLKKETS